MSAFDRRLTIHRIPGISEEIVSEEVSSDND
jgi:hypothetical protein